MFYLIYQIRNKTNNKIYIGKHQTENKDDEYMGSGKYLRYAIEKEGIENFEKTILFECQSEEEMNQKEAEIVDEEFVNREDTYNIALGGDGGPFKNLTFDKKSQASKTRWKNMSNEKRRLVMKAAHNASLNRIRPDLEKQQISNSLKKLYQMNPSKNGMFGKHHSNESKTKMRESHLGENNSQYGKMWICNNETHESKRILKTDIIPDGWRKGRFCK